MAMEEIQCPACWEWFSIATPPESERPCELDYDCEVCCRPFRIICEIGESSWSMSLDD